MSLTFATARKKAMYAHVHVHTHMHACIHTHPLSQPSTCIHTYTRRWKWKKPEVEDEQTILGTWYRTWDCQRLVVNRSCKLKVRATICKLVHRGGCIVETKKWATMSRRVETMPRVQRGRVEPAVGSFSPGAHRLLGLWSGRAQNSCDQYAPLLRNLNKFCFLAAKGTITWTTTHLLKSSPSATQLI